MAFDALPTGVRLLPDLISPAEEATLVAAVDAGSWVVTEDDQRSQQFGWWRPETGLQSHEADRFLGALPAWAEPLVSRLHVLAPFDFAPDHLVVREIVGGAPVGLRRGEGRTVATLVLEGDLPLMLRRREGAGAWHLTLPRRSLLVLTEKFDRNWDRTLAPAGPLPLGARLLTLGFRRMDPA